MLAVRPEALRVQRVRRGLLVQQRRAHRNVLKEGRIGVGLFAAVQRLITETVGAKLKDR